MTTRQYNGTGTHHGTFSNNNLSTQYNARGNMGPITNNAIMIHDRTVIHNAAPANPRIRTDYRVGGKHCTSPYEGCCSNICRLMLNRLENKAKVLCIQRDFLPQPISPQSDMDMLSIKDW
jgi:hypothetical protein